MRPSLLRIGLACVFVLSTACGSVANKSDAGSGGADASQSDGGGNTTADAAPDAATNGMVTVNVYVSDAPAPNIAVMYHKADGSYIGSMLTDSNGQVIIPDMPVGGAVTAPVSPFGQPVGGGQSILTSVTDVQIGDVITIGRSINSVSNNAVGTVTGTIPAALAGGSTYEVNVGCTKATGGAGTAFKTSINDRCVPASKTIDAVAYALDRSSNRIGYSTESAATLSGMVPNLTGTISLPAWQTDLGTYTLQLTNAPADLSVTASFLGYKQSVQVDNDSFASTAITNGNGHTFAFLMAPGFFENTTVSAQAGIPIDASTTRQSVVAIRSDASPTASMPAHVTWDISTDFLQPPKSVTVTADTITSVNWTGGTTSCADNPSPDLLLYVVAGTVGTANYGWFAIAPGSQTTPVTLPQLDPALAQNLWPTSSFDSTSALVVIKSDSAMTYDDFRQIDDNFALDDSQPPGGATRCVTYGL